MLVESTSALNDEKFSREIPPEYKHCFRGELPAYFVKEASSSVRKLSIGDCYVTAKYEKSLYPLPWNKVYYAIHVQNVVCEYFPALDLFPSVDTHNCETYVSALRYYITTTVFFFDIVRTTDSAQ